MTRYVLAAQRRGAWIPLDQHPGSPHQRHATCARAIAASRSLLEQPLPLPVAIVDTVAQSVAWTPGMPMPDQPATQLDLFASAA